MRAITLLLAALLVAQPALAKEESKDGRKPPTKVTQKLSPAVYQKIEKAQAAMELKDLATAEALMNELQAKADKLNDYEKSQMYNFLAAIHYEQGKTDQTIADYFAILKLEKAPEQMRNSAMFRLAQLYFVKEDYAKSIKLLDRWMQAVESVRPDAHILKAQAYYQLEDYAGAEKPIIDAIQEAKRRGQPLKESWLALLRAVYYELGDYSKSARVLEMLVKGWAKPSYIKQLAGMKGLLNAQHEQMLVMHVAAATDMLDNEPDVLNMARLYMAEDVPYAAVELLQQSLENKQIEETAENLQLLAQAMSLAKESEGQIPVLQKAAKLSGEAKQYMYLGQAQISVYRWADAAQSLEKALSIGGLERPGSVYMQVGTAYFNLKKYNSALRAFERAGNYENYAKQAAQWVKFVQSELKRKQAMASS